MRNHVFTAVSTNVDECRACGCGAFFSTAECPGVKIEPDDLKRVQNGQIDFQDDQWVLCRYLTDMLHHVATDRYHPMPYRYAPPPSGDLGETGRFKSIGHHTVGFATLAEAKAWIEERPHLVFTGNILEWTTDETPASVAWFDRKGINVPLSPQLPKAV